MSRWRLAAAAALLVLALPPAAVSAPPEIRLGRENLVRIWPIHYRAHDGRSRRVYVVLPRW